MVTSTVAWKAHSVTWNVYGEVLFERILDCGRQEHHSDLSLGGMNGSGSVGVNSAIGPQGLEKTVRSHPSPMDQFHRDSVLSMLKRTGQDPDLAVLLPR
jgi:hypothetical protein